MRKIKLKTSCMLIYALLFSCDQSKPIEHTGMALSASLVSVDVDRRIASDNLIGFVFNVKLKNISNTRLCGKLLPNKGFKPIHWDFFDKNGMQAMTFPRSTFFMYSGKVVDHVELDLGEEKIIQLYFMPSNYGDSASLFSKSQNTVVEFDFYSDGHDNNLEGSITISVPPVGAQPLTPPKIDPKSPTDSSQNPSVEQEKPSEPKQ